MERELFDRIRCQWAGNGALDAAVNQVIDGLNDPYSVAEEMLATLPGAGSDNLKGKG
jgi:hypothetical protein